MDASADSLDVLIDGLYVNRELFSALFYPLCAKYGLTMTEMVILLYLDKHGPGGTAADIVGRLRIAKSHISASVRDLTQRGYLRGSHAGNDRRAIRLRLCGEAGQVAREGRRVQEEFLRVLLDGLNGAEREALRSYMKRINRNAAAYLRGRDNAKGENAQSCRNSET